MSGKPFEAGDENHERSALHVPQGAPAQLLPWLRGDVRPPATFHLGPVLASADLEAVAIRRLTSFWQDDRFVRLTDATRVLLEGAGRLGWSLIVRVAAEGGVLRYVVAVPGGARALSKAMMSAFPEARLEEIGGRAKVKAALRSRWIPRVRCGLVGVPVNTTRTSRTTLLERLARSGAPDWSLTVHMRIAPPDRLRTRHLELGRLRAQATSAAQRSVQLTATESQTEVDPLAEAVAELLILEEARTVRAMRTLAFLAETWLEGPDDSVEGLAAIAAASLGGDQATVFPVRIMREAQTGAPPAVMLLPAEAALIVQPPATDVRGIAVSRWFPMDSEPEPVNHGGPLLRLGTTTAGAPLDYPADALTAHTLISGATGSGKSSFLKAVLHELTVKVPDVSFLVIEPTKDEYRHLDIPGLQTWVVGEPGSGWRLNPLEVPRGTALATHVDLLLALFASTFALFPPLPYILEMALRRAYEDAGWDFRTGRHRSGGGGLYPTVTDLATASQATVDELGYSGEVLHNVSAALRARLGSLSYGVKGEVLETDAVFDIAALLARPTVVNLDLVANDREKAFLMGLVLIRLWEARRGSSSRSLVHLTIVEEAHRILSQPRPSSNGEGGDGGFAAETFGNLLAEVRAAGEGLIIVDQSPRKLLRDVMTNTALKIAGRTLGPDDRTLLAAGLNIEDAPAALTALANHEALVFWEGMDRPVRAQLAARHTARTAEARRAENVAGTAPVRDEQVERLADTLLRVRAPERSRIWQRLVERVEPMTGSMAAVPAVRATVANAASRLARRRGWSRRDRDALLTEVLPGGAKGADQRAWRDEATCRCVGDPGTEGCRVAEQMLEVARRFRRHHAGFDPTMVSTADLFAVLDPYVQEGLGTSGLRTSLDRVGAVCLATQLAAQVRPLPVARAFRSQLRSEGGGESA